jgi:hypothetical protein
VHDVLVNAGVWVATAAAAISFFALLLSLRNRREDLAREEAYQVRSRVWEILDREPGLRTILALDACDGQTPKRVELLRRTADQLDVAGAPVLARNLREVLDQPWGEPMGEAPETARRDFVESASQFMRPDARNLPSRRGA